VADATPEANNRKQAADADVPLGSKDSKDWF
jgi:hypothetical protein